MQAVLLLLLCSSIWCITRKMEKQVWGGTNAAGNVPDKFIASIRFNNKLECNAAFLDQDWAITTKDCAQRAQELGSDAVLRYSTPQESAGSSVTVLQYFLHETKNVALLRLLSALDEAQSHMFSLGSVTASSTEDIHVASYGCKRATNGLACTDGTYHTLTDNVMGTTAATSAAALLAAATSTVAVDVDVTNYLYVGGIMCVKDWGAPLFRTLDGGEHELLGLYIGNGPQSTTLDPRWDTCGQPVAPNVNGLDMFVNLVEASVHSWIVQTMSCQELQVVLSNPKHGSSVTDIAVCATVPASATGLANEVHLKLPSSGWDFSDATVSSIRGIASSETVAVVTGDDYLQLRYVSPFTVNAGNTYATVRFAVRNVRTPNHCGGEEWELEFHRCAHVDLLGAGVTTVRQCPLEPLAEIAVDASASGFDPYKDADSGCNFCQNQGNSFKLNLPAGCHLCNACKRWYEHGSSNVIFQCEHDGKQFTRSNLEVENGLCFTGTDFGNSRYLYQ